MTRSTFKPARLVGLLRCLATLASLYIGVAVVAVETLTVEVHRKLPHDPEAYTQGLVWWQGRLYESTGRRGRSQLRKIDPGTGIVEHRVSIPLMFFGEGLARVDQRLVMLTWQAEQAFVFAVDGFARVGKLDYRGEGWGLCHDGTRFVMSDGSDRLSFRDSESFALVGTVSVTLEGRPLTNLNELECVDDKIYANVFQHDVIVRVDPATGRVGARIDASGLLDDGESRGADVLNGIAYAPELDRFYVTGKLWPAMFEVTFVGGSDQATADLSTP
ncbi:MAG: glutaminyl-peptide cyclotransferase [Gammaproteobacteria bacterium]|nr:glutaminyl-peptide cyclotransferase [Gammaproteobacteria bacterium]